jgi:hypothetical protein
MATRAPHSQVSFVSVKSSKHWAVGNLRAISARRPQPKVTLPLPQSLLNTGLLEICARFPLGALNPKSRFLLQVACHASILLTRLFRMESGHCATHSLGWKRSGRVSLAGVLLCLLFPRGVLGQPGVTRVVYGDTDSLFIQCKGSCCMSRG